MPSTTMLVSTVGLGCACALVLIVGGCSDSSPSPLAGQAADAAAPIDAAATTPDAGALADGSLDPDSGTADAGRPPGVCGDGVINPGEACDGAALDGLTCASFGYPEGTVVCNEDCTGHVVAGCDGRPTWLQPPSESRLERFACLSRPRVAPDLVRATLHDIDVTYSLRASQSGAQGVLLDAAGRSRDTFRIDGPPDTSLPAVAFADSYTPLTINQQPLLPDPVVVTGSAALQLQDGRIAVTLDVSARGAAPDQVVYLLRRAGNRVLGQVPATTGRTSFVIAPGPAEVWFGADPQTNGPGWRLDNRDFDRDTTVDVDLDVTETEAVFHHPFPDDPSPVTVTLRAAPTTPDGLAFGDLRPAETLAPGAPWTARVSAPRGFGVQLSIEGSVGQVTHLVRAGDQDRVDVGQGPTLTVRRGSGSGPFTVAWSAATTVGRGARVAFGADDERRAVRFPAGTLPIVTGNETLPGSLEVASHEHGSDGSELEADPPETRQVSADITVNDGEAISSSRPLTFACLSGCNGRLSIRQRARPDGTRGFFGAVFPGVYEVTQGAVLVHPRVVVNTDLHRQFDRRLESLTVQVIGDDADRYDTTVISAEDVEGDGTIRANVPSTVWVPVGPTIVEVERDVPQAVGVVQYRQIDVQTATTVRFDFRDRNLSVEIGGDTRRMNRASLVVNAAFTPGTTLGTIPQPDGTFAFIPTPLSTELALIAFDGTNFAARLVCLQP